MPGPNPLSSLGRKGVTTVEKGFGKTLGRSARGSFKRKGRKSALDAEDEEIMLEFKKTIVRRASENDEQFEARQVAEIAEQRIRMLAQKSETRSAQALAKDMMEREGGVVSRESKGFLDSWTGKGIALLFGYEMLVSSNSQDESECEKSCITRENGDVTAKYDPKANCPEGKTKVECEKYCSKKGSGVCTQEKCLEQSSQFVTDNPLGALATTMNQGIKDTTSFWDTFKYAFFVGGGLIALLLMYKFATAWTRGRVSHLEDLGTRRGQKSSN